MSQRLSKVKALILLIQNFDGYNDYNEGILIDVGHKNYNRIKLLNNNKLYKINEESQLIVASLPLINNFLCRNCVNMDKILAMFKQKNFG